jgi:glycosyltransferase involved in cell wall biosynthesis
MMLWQIISHGSRERFHHSVISLTPGGKYAPMLEDIGVKVVSLNMKPGRPGPVALFKLAHSVRRLAPDVIMGWMYHGVFAALLARWSLFKNVPVIANVRQSLDSLANEKRGSAMVIRLLAKVSHRFTNIIYNSRRSAQQHEALGYDKSKTQIIFNGVDTQSFTASDDARRAIREELGLPQDALLVGRIGRNHPMKDHATFLDAAAILARENPKVHFVLAGTGVDASDPALAAHAAVSRAHLLGERHDLPRLTAALDVACSSSAFGEGFPNVIAEAMACSVPCIATDIGDTAHVLGGGGALVPPKDVKALAGALREAFMLSPDHRRALGAASRERITRSFSLASAITSFETLFPHRPGSEPLTLGEKPCVA